MASFILACVTCCCSTTTPSNRKFRSFFTSPTTPKHKRPKHNPPLTIPHRHPQPATLHNTQQAQTHPQISAPSLTSTSTPNPNPTTTTTTTERYTSGATTSQDYTFEALKLENERRVRMLAEAGVMDVPHGVLSKEVGTPELAPKYLDAVESANESEELRLEGSEADGNGGVEMGMGMGAGT